MPSFLRFLAPLSCVLALAACGGDKTESAKTTADTSSADADALLRDTFANVEKLTSATLDFTFKLEGSGENVSASFSGPYESQGETKLPKFAFTAKAEAAGQSFDAGVTHTGSKAYVSFLGDAYEVSDSVLKQIADAYEQSVKQQQPNQDAFDDLGIDFKAWLPNPVVDGGEQVGGVDTVKISGSPDIERVLADVDKITEKAATLPGATGTVPQKLTPAQKQAIQDAVKSLKVTLYTGADDHLLRRLTVAADVVADDADADLTLDLTLTKVGESQEFPEPENPKPFSELEKLFGSATGGLLQGLGGGSSGASGTPNNVDKYAKCIEDAGGDAAKAQKCADLLTG